MAPSVTLQKCLDNCRGSIVWQLLHSCECHLVQLPAPLCVLGVSCIPELLVTHAELLQVLMLLGHASDTAVADGTFACIA